MPKKRTKTSSTKKTKRKSKDITESVKRITDREIEHAILSNMVELQKVQTNLTEKFDHLAKQIEQLLSLFEITARNFAKNAPQTEEYTKDKDFLDKIDKLLDQNKLLAKGLTIMEERLRERMYTGPSQKRPAPKGKRPDENPFEPSMTSKRQLPRF